MTTETLALPGRVRTWNRRVLLQWRVTALVVILVLWQLVVVASVLPSIAPSPIEVIAAIWSAATEPIYGFWPALGQTVLNSVTGWAIAVVFGVVLGLLLGMNKWVTQSTSIVVDFGRAVPVLALMPILILFLGKTTVMEVVVITVGAFWPVLVQSMLGSRRRDPGIVETTKIYQIPATLRFFRVLLPSALPFIVTGVRIAASIAILTAVGVEVIEQSPGIGFIITRAQENGRWDLTFAYLFFAGVFGWAVTAALQAAERRVLRWNRQAES